MTQDKLFTNVDQNWDLDKIYQQLNTTKQIKFKGGELNNLEKTILRGLLCGYSPKNIANKMQGESAQYIINLVWKIERYIQESTQQYRNIELNSNRYIRNSLIEAGYHKKIKKRKQNLSELKTTNNASILDSNYISSSTEFTQKPNTYTQPQNIQTLPVPNNLSLPEKVNLPKENTINKSQLSLPSAVSNHQGNIVPASPDYLTPVLENELLPTVSRWNTWGGIIVLGCVGIAVTLASLVKYDVVIKASATVRPQGEVKLVQAKREGTIKSIQVQENQTVDRGEVIAYLDDSQLQSQKKQLETSIQQDKLQLTQINSQISALERQIIAEKDRIDRAIASAKAELHYHQRDYQEKQITSKAQVQEATAQLNIAQRELAKAETELQSARANLKSTEASLAVATAKRDRYQSILSSGAIAQERFDEVQLEVQQQEQALESQKARVLGHKQTLEAQKQAIQAAEAKLVAFQAALNPSSASVSIAKANIEQEKAKGNATIAHHLREKEALMQQRSEKEKQIAKDIQQLQQLVQEIDKTIVRATTTGTILKLNLRNAHQVINQSDIIAQITPQNSSLEFKAKIDTDDRDKVALGQPVKLRVGGCPYPDYGTLAGVVTAVSPDTIASQENSPNSQKHFALTIKAGQEFLDKGDRFQPNHICLIYPGMEAQADIITQSETPLQFFLRKARLITDL